MSLMERRKHRDLVIEWLRESYFVGHSGSLAKAAVYKEYLVMCRHLQLSPLSSPAFGKIVHKGKDISFASPLLPQLHKQIRPESLPPLPPTILICVFFFLPFLYHSFLRKKHDQNRGECLFRSHTLRHNFSR